MDSRLSDTQFPETKPLPETREIDIRGQICPSSLLTTLKEINELQGDLTLQKLKLSILTDNRDATATIPAAAERMGYRVSVAREGSHYVISIQK